MFTDSHSILPRWRNHFTQPMKGHAVGDVRQTKTHTAGLLVPEPSAFEFEIAIEKLKRHKSPGNDQIPAELIKAESRVNSSENLKLTNSILSTEEFPEKWTESFIVFIYKKGDKTDCSDYKGMSLLSTMYKILSSILLSRLTPYGRNYWGSSMWISKQQVNY